MSLRPLLAPALLLAALLAACGSDSSSGPQILRVGTDYKTIQAAVDAAKPGDLVLIGSGTYHEAVSVTTEQLVIRGEDRNDVILDGRDELGNGFDVQADQVAIENLTVKRYAINGIIFNGGYGSDDPQSGPVGWRASYVTAANNGLYGLYAFGTGPGQFDHDYASGHPDSGIYVGQCQDCGAVVRDNVMERNAIGYENTNASGVTVAANTIRHNRVGMSIASGKQEELAPQDGGDIVANLVTDNNEPESPSTQGGFGFGIVIAGGTNNTVSRNTVSVHSGAGIVLVDQDGYVPTGNRVTENDLSRNETDLALTATTGQPTDGGDNCFSGNDPDGTVPADLESALPCDADPAAQLGDATLAYPDAPKGISYTDVELPTDQPNRPGNPEGPWKPPARTAPKLDLEAFQVPTP